MSAASAREVARINRCRIDGGDRELAFRVLNLHARAHAPPPAVPPLPDFVAHVNTLLQLISARNFHTQHDRTRASTAVRRVRSALRTVCRLQNSAWMQANFRTLVVGAGDLPLNLRWDRLAPPLGFAQARAHVAALPPGRRVYNENVVDWDAPTRNELRAGLVKSREDWRGEPEMHEAMVDLEIWPDKKIIREVPTLGTGECYWHAIR